MATKKRHQPRKRASTRKHMAKRRHTKKRTTRKRRTINGLSVAKKSTTKRKSAKAMTFMDALWEVGKGVTGAVIVAKFGDKIPIQNAKARNGVVLGLSIMGMLKPGPMRSFAIGTGISSGTMLAAEFMPDIVAPAGGKTVGRLSPETVRQMQAAARMRGTMNGLCDRTIVGTGAGGDFPQPVNGMRDRTIVGSGDPSIQF